MKRAAKMFWQSLLAVGCAACLGIASGCMAEMLMPSACAEAAAAEINTDTVYAVSDVTEGSQETVIDSGEVPEFVTWLLEIAQAELGYAEGRHGYTKYGEWAGDPTAEWCAEFICWCVDQVDANYGTSLLTNVYPKYSGQNVGKEWFITKGRFVFRRGNCPGWGYQWLLGDTKLMKKNDYIPEPGDLMFFSYNAAGDTEHVALVEYSAYNESGEVIVHVIEGNNPSMVARNSYRLDNSQILGFGACKDVVGTTMRSGNRGDKVRWLQESLHTLGYLEEHHITGTFGGNTKTAVSVFQQEMEKKTVNGIADMDTQNALRLAMAEKEFHSPETWLVEE